MLMTNRSFRLSVRRLWLQLVQLKVCKHGSIISFKEAVKLNFQTTAVFDFLMATKKSYFHSLAKNCLFYSYWMTRNAMGGRVFCSFGLISSFNTKTLFTFSTKFPLCEILLFILIKRLPGRGTVGLSPRPQHLPKVCLTPDRHKQNR